MADFSVVLTFLDATLHPMPQQTDLLLLDQAAGNLTRGWVEADGELVMLAARWQPTHFANLTQALQQREPRPDALGLPLL